MKCNLLPSTCSSSTELPYQFMSQQKGCKEMQWVTVDIAACNVYLWAFGDSSSPVRMEAVLKHGDCVGAGFGKSEISMIFCALEATTSASNSKSCQT